MGKKSFARKPPVPVPICPLQIPHNLPRSPKPILAVADRNFKNKANYIYINVPFPSHRDKKIVILFNRLVLRES